jgi:hypothetical protein
MPNLITRLLRNDRSFDLARKAVEVDKFLKRKNEIVLSKQHKEIDFNSSYIIPAR